MTNSSLMLAVLAVPLLGGLASLLALSDRTRFLLVVPTGVATLALGLTLIARVVQSGPVAGLNQWLYVDDLDAVVLLVVVVVAALAGAYSVAYFRSPAQAHAMRPGEIRKYFSLFHFFTFTMVLATVAGNLILLWTAVTATTFAAAPLVDFYGSHEPLEAAWKFLVLAVAGELIALLGFFLLFEAGIAALGASYNFSIPVLDRAGPHLNGALGGIGFLMVLVGFGTKAGLAPMHTWLPDAHSQAPAPVSALMSGVLLTVAFYALLRFKAVADGALGPGYSRTLLVIVGLASLLVAASLLLTQRDVKRMLAYHSIEHMGLIALGAAAGTTLAIAAVLLHILGHGLAKAVLFLASGEILLVEGTSEIDKIPSLLARRPLLGGIFGFGLVALLGLPPFSLFVSELNMIRGELAVGLGWAAGLSLLAMAVIFAAVMAHGRHLLLGGRGATPSATSRLVGVPLVGGLVACVFFGLSAWPLQSLLDAAARVVVR